MKKNFVFLADGFEDIEALATVDILRRAGMDVATVSIHEGRKMVKSAHGVGVEADLTFKEADFGGSDWLIMPGGLPGAQHLHDFEALNDLLRVHKGRIAAICASPALVLGPAGVVQGLDATCYPGMEQGLTDGGARPVADVPYVATERVITGRGPGATFAFALVIVAATKGEAVASELAKGMLIKG